jgi:hypothetical protein
MDPLSPEDEALMRHVDGLDEELPPGLHQGTKDEKLKREIESWSVFDSWPWWCWPFLKEPLRNGDDCDDGI